MANIETILSQIKAMECHLNLFATIQLSKGPIKLDKDEDMTTGVIGAVLFSHFPGNNPLFWSMMEGWNSQPLLLPTPKLMEYQQWVTEKTLPVAFV